MNFTRKVTGHIFFEKNKGVDKNKKGKTFKLYKNLGHQSHENH